MGRLLLLSLFSLILASCGVDMDAPFEKTRYCEATMPYKDGVLVTSYGTDWYKPLNNEGKGYVSFQKGEKSVSFIPKDGYLSAPKGLAVYRNHLFVSEVNKIVVYDLRRKSAVPQVIRMPEGEQLVKGLAVKGRTLFAIVMDTGNIYTIDISDVKNLNAAVTVLFANVPHASGIAVDGEKLYVASYGELSMASADGRIHTLYEEEGILKDEYFIRNVGKFDGLFLSQDKKHLYFTSWLGSEVGRIDVETKEVKFYRRKVEFGGPAQLSVAHDKLYVPDVLQSYVTVFDAD